MCGLCGWVWTEAHRPVDRAVIDRMMIRLRHRGPDGEGTWFGPGIGLGHQRLSVIDLSGAGRQPLSNEDETVWVVFNGEIYNFQQLRAELARAGHRFRSQTDTEVLVHLYEAEGVECLTRLRGMFAFALWDVTRRRLLLARDRFGQKPLYYRVTPDRILFASELSALLVGVDVSPPIDPLALEDYLTYQHVPSPRSILQGMSKLPPAHSLVWEAGQVRIERYWSLASHPPRSTVTLSAGTALLNELGERLDEAVRLQLVSDVPVGVFLSGGLDSSLIAESMVRQSPTRVRTFSVGFDDAAYDETPFARAVAEQLGTEHHELHVAATDLSIVPSLIRFFGEPFADSSAIPTYALSQFARRHVKVILNGDGSDEQFAGYPRYVSNQWSEWARWIPPTLSQRLLGPCVARVAKGRPYTAFSSRLERWISDMGQPVGRRNAYRLSHFTPSLKARVYTSTWLRRLRGHDPYQQLEACYDECPSSSFTAKALYADCKLYLPDDLLTKVDRMSMAHGLEVRSPFLDHELAAFVARLPIRWKLDGLRTKVALRRLGKGRLPRAVLHRPKMGFAVPLHTWLRTALRPWLYEIVLSERALDRGYFRPEAVRLMVEEHVSGERDWRYPLWNLLILELWHRQFVDPQSPELLGDHPSSAWPIATHHT